MSRKSKKPQTPEEQRAVPFIGLRMRDGTIFIGLSPDTQKPIYAAPQPLDQKLSHAAAEEYAAQLTIKGHDNTPTGGFRLPTADEMTVLIRRKANNSLTAAFNKLGWNAWLHTAGVSSRGTFRLQHVSDNRRGDVREPDSKAGVFCIRDGAWPTLEAAEVDPARRKQIQNHIDDIAERGNGDVSPERAALLEQQARAEQYLGLKMGDGTIFAGVSPDTLKPIYAAPEDAGLRFSFNDASNFAEGLALNGRSDFRLPTKAELSTIYAHKDAGALEGTFVPDDNYRSAWYWTSTQDNKGRSYAERFTPGRNRRSSYPVENDYSVRCVRDGEWPTEETIKHSPLQLRQNRLKVLQQRKLKLL